MRTIEIALNDDKTVTISNDTVGFVEESNATELIITLNQELLSSDIDYHIICFRHGENDEKLVSGKLKIPENPESPPDAYRAGNDLHIMLPQYITSYKSLYVQIEGHILKTENGSEHIYSVIKSPIFSLRLDDSIVGYEGEFNTAVEGIFADLKEMENRIKSGIELLLGIQENGTIPYTLKPQVSDIYSLSPEDWMKTAKGNYTQTLGTNTLASDRNEIDVELDSVKEWADCKVFAVSETDNEITFECEVLPLSSLYFRITSTEVDYAQ